jgi:hypothetical protein
MRNGFTEFTSVTGCVSAMRRTMSSAWSKLPSTTRTLAPWIAACESLPSATAPRGTMTKARSPARAAKAAAEAEVLPVEAQITAREPASTALDMAIVMPRSLNEPVGLKPSHLRKMATLGSVASASRGAGTSGVLPSSSVTTGVLSLTGRYRR